MISDERLREIERIAGVEASEPVPLRVQATLLREAVPDLLAEVRRLREALERAVEEVGGHPEDHILIKGIPFGLISIDVARARIRALLPTPSKENDRG